MAPTPLPPEEDIERLRGHHFPGGSIEVAHWENFLLTDCTGADLLPGGMVHPVALFHLPIQGAGTSIAEMFALGQAESDLSIMIESYDWQLFESILEDTRYQVCGEITEADRRHNEQGGVYDRIQFCFKISRDEQPIARSRITWHYTRNLL